MGLLSSLEQRSTLKNPAGWFEKALTGEMTSAGVKITHDKVNGLTAFWNGVNVISQTVAALPIHVFERDGEERRPRTDTRQWRILNQRPNPMMSPFTFKELRIAHLLAHGNSYCEKQLDGAGRVVALWPLLPDRTDIELVEGKKMFWTIVNGKKVWLSPDRVMHVPGPGFDGLKGYNPVHVHRRNLGLTEAANEYGARFFGNGGRPSGAIVHPNFPGEEERTELKESWNQVHQGLTNAQRTALLWGGVKYEQFSMAPDDAQFLETRAFQIEEIARILNINPILLHKTQGVTTWGTAIGQFLTAFLRFTIQPWLVRDEEVFDHDLFAPNQREKMYTKYNEDAVARGDPKMQAEILQIKRQNGIINADQWRALDDEDPLPDGQGQIYTIPANMGDLAKINERPQPSGGLFGGGGNGGGGDDEPDPDNDGDESGGGEGETDSAPDNSGARPPRELTDAELPAKVEFRTRTPMELRSQQQRRALRQAHREAIEDGARRSLRRETQALERAIKRAEQSEDPAGSLNQWIENFYPGQHEAIRSAIGPAITSLSLAMAAVAAAEIDADPPDEERVREFADDFTNGVATREVNSSKGQLRQIMEGTASVMIADAVRQRAEEWNEKRPSKTAEAETVRAAEGAARHTWQNTGSVTRLVWDAGGEACPICMEMHGVVAQINGVFLNEGDQVNPGGGTEPLRTDVKIVSPPLHGGCDCQLVPE